jgi:hypothetical protein
MGDVNHISNWFHVFFFQTKHYLNSLKRIFIEVYVGITVPTKILPSTKKHQSPVTKNALLFIAFLH